MMLQQQKMWDEVLDLPLTNYVIWDKLVASQSLKFIVCIMGNSIYFMWLQ